MNAPPSKGIKNFNNTLLGNHIYIENESSSEMHVHYIIFCFQIDKQ